MKDKFIQIYNTYIHRAGAAELLAWIMSADSDFFVAPASTKYHLCVPGGLVAHSVHVYNRLRSLYIMEAQGRCLSAEEEESIAICGLLHDLCKVNVYHREAKNRKTYDPQKVNAAEWREKKRDTVGEFIWETVEGYSFSDDLPYGHGEKSVFLINGFMGLRYEEAFAIRYHMGPWQEGEKNNAGKAFEKYPLAFLTHIADQMATYIDEREN